MKVVCEICKREFSTLNSHMHRSHGLTLDEYRELYPGAKTSSDEYAEKQSKAMKRRNESLKFSESVSERNKVNWTKKEYRGKQVLSMIKKHNKSIKGVHTSCKCKSFVAYKSDFELTYAKYLDTLPEVESYDSESFVIWYVHNKEDRMYIPDFIVNYRDGHTEVVEIKPESHHSAHDDLLENKFIAARNYCDEHGFKFVIVRG